MWTLEYGGQEKTFEAWGFTEPVMTIANQVKRTFRVRMPGFSALLGDPPIPFRGQVVIRRGRSAGLTGGEIVFQGRQVTEGKHADPMAPSDSLVFADAWHDLENLVYQQQWAYKVAGQPISSGWFSRLNLFQNYAERVIGGQTVLPGARITNGQQIKDVIAFAVQCGVVIQAGTVDPVFPLPVYPVKAITCAEAIAICLREVADATCWIDPSTTPPTFHCRQRANLTPVTLPFADGVRHKSSELVPRYDLQVPAVVLQYEKLIQDNDETYTAFGVDAYPVGKTGLEPYAIVCPIDLRGAVRRDVKVTVKAAAVNPASLDWWKLKKADFASPKIANLALVGAPTVTDDAGAAISLASYPNEHVRGEVLTWMRDGSNNPITAKYATVKAKFTYKQLDADGREIAKVQDANPHEVAVRVRLTNSAAGESQYSANEFNDAGETAPEGLAQHIYTALQALQWEGRHVVVYGPAASETMAIVGTWNTLNLSGGQLAWSAMNAMVQEVEIDFFRGRQEISIGPARHLAPGEMNELLQLFRFRMVHDNPNLRISAEETAGGITIGGDAPAENTTQGNPPLAMHVVSAPAPVTPP